MTILGDAAPAVQSVRGLQMSAALALAHLLEHALPPVNWHISRDVEALSGYLENAQARPDLAAYAEFLGAPVTLAPHPDVPELGRFEVRAVYRGVPVRVWAYATPESAVAGS